MEKITRNILIGLGAITGGGLIAVITNAYSNTRKIGKRSNVLFIGDSITAGNFSYADQLAKLIPSLNVKKIAKGGMRTDWMLDNAKADLQSGNYDAVFILGGINDAYSQVSISGIEKNLQAMYDLGRRNGAKVYALTVVPSENYVSYNNFYGTRAEALNSWIRGNKSVTKVIDYNKLLKTNGKQNTALFAPDALHPNTKGHTVLAEYINKNVFKG